MKSSFQVMNKMKVPPIGLQSQEEMSKDATKEFTSEGSHLTSEKSIGAAKIAPEVSPELSRKCLEVNCLQLNLESCSFCNELFCQIHYKITFIPISLGVGHACRETVARAAVCPLCEQIVAVPRGKDVDKHMHQHVKSKCPQELGPALNKAYIYLK